MKTVVQEKQEEHALDSSLEDFPVDEVNGVFSIALMCLEPEPYKRPTMAEVLKMLEKVKRMDLYRECETTFELLHNMQNIRID